MTFLHQNLRCLRKRMNLSQEELAGRVGLNRGNIASYENGSAEPKICNLLKLSNLFGVSIIDLTQKDLSIDENYLFASSQFQKITLEEREIIEKFSKQVEEISHVFQSLHTCCQYKTRSMNELSRDVQIVLVHFEQLFETSQLLLCNHRALLDLIRHRMK